MVERRNSVKTPARKKLPDPADRGSSDDMRELEDALKIDEYALNDALSKQPELFYRVGKILTVIISRRDAAKQALQDEEARADLRTRDQAACQDRKITEGEVRAIVQIDDRVSEARDVLSSLGEEVGKLSVLKEAFMQRSYALKDLVALYQANYYSASTENAGGGVRDRAAQQGRQAMSEVRRNG